jgi:hypothetical protein
MDAMNMNRFGIRMAAGLAVACLSGLAIYQVKSGSDSVVEDDWPLTSAVAATDPPAPLGLAATNDTVANELDPLTSGFFPADSQGGLRRVSYDAPLPLENGSDPAADPAAGLAAASACQPPWTPSQ